MSSDTQAAAWYAWQELDNFIERYQMSETVWKELHATVCRIVAAEIAVMVEEEEDYDHSEV